MYSQRYRVVGVVRRPSTDDLLQEMRVRGAEEVSRASGDRQEVTKGRRRADEGPGGPEGGPSLHTRCGQYVWCLGTDLTDEAPVIRLYIR